MKRTLLVLRTGFILLCGGGGLLLASVNPDWLDQQILATLMGLGIGALIVLTDLLLKGFSLRQFTAMTAGLALGALVSLLLGSSPLFQYGDPSTLFVFRLSLFLVCSYLGMVVALRSRDEFNFVIPYIKFVPHNVESPLIVVDASALTDGRIVRLCESGLVSSALVVPRFVLAELQHTADSPDPARQARGRRGLDALTSLRAIKQVEIRIHEAEVEKSEDVEGRILFIAQSLKARLLTTDQNLAKLAQFHGINWINLAQVARALTREITVGERLEVDLVKPGREDGQGVGYVEDGSMVVVNEGRAHLGRRVLAEVISLVPSAAGRIIFARFLGELRPSG